MQSMFGNLSNPKPVHTTGGTGRGGAWRGGGAGRERAGRDADAQVRPEYDRLSLHTPQIIEENPTKRVFGSANNRIVI